MYYDNVFVNYRALIHPPVENPWFKRFTFKKKKGFKFHSILPDWVDEQSVFLLDKGGNYKNIFINNPHITEKALKVDDFTKENFSS